jgi:hypothetical protein
MTLQGILNELLRRELFLKAHSAPTHLSLSDIDGLDKYTYNDCRSLGEMSQQMERCFQNAIEALELVFNMQDKLSAAKEIKSLKKTLKDAVWSNNEYPDSDPFARVKLCMPLNTMPGKDEVTKLKKNYNLT